MAASALFADTGALRAQRRGLDISRALLLPPGLERDFLLGEAVQSLAAGSASGSDSRQQEEPDQERAPERAWADFARFEAPPPAAANSQPPSPLGWSPAAAAQLRAPQQPGRGGAAGSKAAASAGGGSGGRKASLRQRAKPSKSAPNPLS